MATRQCIVSRESADETDLIRFVRAPEGTVVPDLLRKLPGRGVWVSVSREKVAEAVKRQAFARGFEAPTQVAADLPDLVGRLLRQQALQHLSLARKAGLAVSGFSKVESLLAKGQAYLLLHASDSAADGRRKLDRMAGPQTLIFRHFSSAEMDLAFARPNAIHAAVAAGGIAERLVHHLRRAARYDGLEF